MAWSDYVAQNLVFLGPFPGPSLVLTYRHPNRTTVKKQNSPYEEGGTEEAVWDTGASVKTRSSRRRNQTV